MLAVRLCVGWGQSVRGLICSFALCARLKFIVKWHAICSAHSVSMYTTDGVNVLYARKLTEDDESVMANGGEMDQ
ncbi:hypothetical protein KS4_20860 [Poriferisphaera corsica]|uniref:Uncharacterized protein n=1 Tax=Poriferisphaera corsica TaxID=2528020 RepID=A0A517YUZ2_9BACT|nr:hypothetical protein KS4_20860 [Poriferisphaera corsica]